MLDASPAFDDPTTRATGDLMALFSTLLPQGSETYLFPEIMPGRIGRSPGDVFFKNVWLNIKSHLTLVKPGQAVHSGRHMVSIELKMLQTFEAFRSD